MEDRELISLAALGGFGYVLLKNTLNKKAGASEQQIETESSDNGLLFNTIQPNPSLVWLSGSTYPSAPVLGQQFFYTPTKMIKYWDGTQWQNFMSLQAVDLYVDGALGTDDYLHGYASGASAFRTVDYARRQLPAFFKETCHIHVASGNYNERVSFSNQSYQAITFATGSGQQAISVIGTLTLISDLVATGGTIGAGATVASITGAFVVGSNEGNLVKFTSGANNGLYRRIGYTTAGTMYLVGAPLAAAPINGDTYSIYSNGTTIQQGVSVNTGYINFEDLALSKSTTGGIGTAYAYQSRMRLKRCYILTTGEAMAVSADAALVDLWESFIKVTVAGYYIGAGADWNANIDLENTLIIGNGKGAGNGVGVRCSSRATINVKCSDIRDQNTGVVIQQGGMIEFSTGGVLTFIHGNQSYGIQAATQGCGTSTTAGTHVRYGVELDNATADTNTGGNTTADAATYSTIS